MTIVEHQNIQNGRIMKNPPKTMRVLGVSKLPPARPRAFCSAFGRGGGIEKPRLGSLGARHGAML